MAMADVKGRAVAAAQAKADAVEAQETARKVAVSSFLANWTVSRGQLSAGRVGCCLTPADVYTCV